MAAARRGFAALVALILLCLAWELWLAPLRPGGSLLALKALPLALPLGGILGGRRYTYQWSSMLILAYFAEGVMRAWGEHRPVADPGVRRSRCLAWFSSPPRSLRAADSSSRLAAA